MKKVNRNLKISIDKAAYISFGLTLFWYIIILFSSSLYKDVDNFNISLITNGLFGEENYTYYLHPGLCALINIVSTILPSADVYALLLHIFVFLAVWTNLFLVIKSRLSIRGKITFILVILVSLTTISIWNINFTVIAAFLTLTGAVLLISNVERCKPLYIIIGTLFICVGFMWRIQGALLTIPFIVLDIVFYIVEEKDQQYKLRVKRVFRTFTFPVLCVFVLTTSQYVIQNQEEYTDALRYSAYRSSVEDFPVKSWEEISGSIQSVSETEYDAATSWILMDTEHINLELLKEIADEGQVNAYTFSVGGIIQTLNEMFHFVIIHRLWTFILGAIILCCLGIIIIGKRNITQIIETALLFIGGTIILFFFTFKGRAVNHIWISVVLCIGYFEILCVIRKLQTGLLTNIQKIVCGLIIVICVGGIGYWAINTEWHLPELAVNSRVDNYAEKIEKDYEDNELYIWGAWHKNITQTYISMGKLPTQEFMEHNIAAGDWIYGQPYFNEHLSSINAENPALALLERKNTYFVDEDCSFVLKYLQEHFGDAISVQQVDTIKGIPVWQFKR